MLTLVFDPAKIPRTITRKEWKEIWRWKRVTQKKIAEETQKQIDNFVIYGSTMPQHIKEDIMDRMIFPPLLLGPYQ